VRIGQDQDPAPGPCIVQPGRRGHAVHVRQIRVDDGDIRSLAAGHWCYRIAASQFRDDFDARCGGQQRRQAGSHQDDFLGDEDTYRSACGHQRGQVS
jgi:hypothetical protein